MNVLLSWHSLCAQEHVHVVLVTWLSLHVYVMCLATLHYMFSVEFSALSSQKRKATDQVHVFMIKVAC